MKLNAIGERVYKLVTTAVYADDGTYSCGCIRHLGDGRIQVVFYKYQNGKGIIGMAKPSAEIVRQLKLNGRDLKEYVNQIDQLWGGVAGPRSRDGPDPLVGSSQPKSRSSSARPHRASPTD